MLDNAVKESVSVLEMLCEMGKLASEAEMFLGINCDTKVREASQEIPTVDMIVESVEELQGRQRNINREIGRLRNA